MTRASTGLPVSVQVRLVRHARALGVDPNLVLTRFAIERFLYRLSCSPHGDRFVLKGALLMLVWLGEMIRPTRDADLLSFGDLSAESLARVVADVCSIDVEPDGLEYRPSSIRVAPIRDDAEYGGLRATVQARLGNARLRVQVDVGIGDAITPAPEWLEYPTLLEFPGPKLRAYPPETVIAEKLHAMVTLGAANSRMRDFFDIDALAAQRPFDATLLAAAIRATFQRRKTPIPATLPLALTPEFAAMDEKQVQWRAYLRKSGLTSAPADLAEVVTRIAGFLGPAIAGAESEASPKMVWLPGGPWRTA